MNNREWTTKNGDLTWNYIYRQTFLRPQEMSKAFPSASVTGAGFYLERWRALGHDCVWEIGQQYFGAMLDLTLWFCWKMLMFFCFWRCFDLFNEICCRKPPGGMFYGISPTTQREGHQHYGQSPERIFHCLTWWTECKCCTPTHWHHVECLILGQVAARNQTKSWLIGARRTVPSPDGRGDGNDVWPTSSCWRHRGQRDLRGARAGISGSDSGLRCHLQLGHFGARPGPRAGTWDVHPVPLGAHAGGSALGLTSGDWPSACCWAFWLRAGYWPPRAPVAHSWRCVQCHLINWVAIIVDNKGTVSLMGDEWTSQSTY